MLIRFLRRKKVRTRRLGRQCRWLRVVLRRAIEGSGRSCPDIGRRREGIADTLGPAMQRRLRGFEHRHGTTGVHIAAGRSGAMLAGMAGRALRFMRAVMLFDRCRCSPLHSGGSALHLRACLHRAAREGSKAEKGKGQQKVSHRGRAYSTVTLLARLRG